MCLIETKAKESTSEPKADTMELAVTVSGICFLLAGLLEENHWDL